MPESRYASRINTIADGSRRPWLGRFRSTSFRRLVADVIVIDDDLIAEGMRFLAQRAKLVAEPAGGAATAALLAGKIRCGRRARRIDRVGRERRPRADGADLRRVRSSLRGRRGARNPGPAGARAVLYDEKERSSRSWPVRLGRATNNVAEYSALNPRARGGPWSEGVDG